MMRNSWKKMKSYDQQQRKFSETRTDIRKEQRENKNKNKKREERKRKTRDLIKMMFVFSKSCTLSVAEEDHSYYFEFDSKLERGSWNASIVWPFFNNKDVKSKSISERKKGQEKGRIEGQILRGKAVEDVH
jgi:hypothetical protein